MKRLNHKGKRLHILRGWWRKLQRSGWVWKGYGEASVPAF